MAICVFAAPLQAQAEQDKPATHAVFGKEQASKDARDVANWIVQTGDNHNKPFAILDKKDAKVFVFYADGTLRGAGPALLGLGRGDVALPGIGARELSDIPPKDRVTPAGRFVVEIGTDTHQEDVLWLDYDGGLAMHRVATNNPKERREQRLATRTPADNRISWGCINLTVKFYEGVVRAAFKDVKGGVAYILPETRPARAFFAAHDLPSQSQTAGRSDPSHAAGGN